MLTHCIRWLKDMEVNICSSTQLNNNLGTRVIEMNHREFNAFDS